MKKWDKINRVEVQSSVTINRTLEFDDLMQSVRDGYWRLPGEASDLPPNIELMIDHGTALKRDIEKRKQPSVEVDLTVWRRLRADHLAQ